jgi:hypothetical protein
MLMPIRKIIAQWLALGRTPRKEKSERNFCQFKSTYEAIAAANNSTSIKNGISDADQSDCLLPGIYRLSWLEFVERFGWNNHRRKLLKGLNRQIEILKSAGCGRVILGGSLLSRKPLPGDFDGCFDLEDVDRTKLALLEPRLLAVDRSELERADGGALVPSIYIPSLGATTTEFLQFDTQRQRVKGVVLIEL